MSNDLQEFENNPDLNIDEENIEDLIKQLDDDSEIDDSEKVDPQPKADDEKPDDKSNEEKSSAEEDDKKAEEKETEAEKVVLSNDGKHEIPYSVLQNERTKNRELQREIEALKAEKSDKAQESDDKEDKSLEESGLPTDIGAHLEHIREELGDEAAELERKRIVQFQALEAQNKALAEEVAENKKWRESQEAKSHDDVASQVNEAIDSIPTLQKWRDEDSPMWAAAVALDERLKSDPANVDLSFKQRFELVVEQLTGQKPSQKQTPEEIEQQLDKKLKEAKESNPPSSLSDLPGGQVPAQSEEQALEGMTMSQLETKFENMTPQQLEEYLARI